MLPQLRASGNERKRKAVAQFDTYYEYTASSGRARAPVYASVDSNGEEEFAEDSSAEEEFWLVNCGMASGNQSARQRSESSAVCTDDALTRLEAEVAAQGPAWRIAQRLVLAAPWHERWKAGRWVATRTGLGPAAMAFRSNMTSTQRSRFGALPYGERVPCGGSAVPCG